MKQRIIGILGGMGPEATADLFIRIIKSTPAEKDQDHLRIIIDNNPKIPDRTEAIIGRGPSPLLEMIKTAKNLEKAGADFIIIPCNTAHFFYEKLRESVNIPILNMIELTAERILDKYPHIKRVGLIGTTGTVVSGIYSKALGKNGIEVVYPSKEFQNIVMKAIYDYIKAGKVSEGRKIIIRVAKYLIKKGIEAVICGCTEISLVLKDGDLSIPVIDPLQILAETAVKKALEGDIHEAIT